MKVFTHLFLIMTLLSCTHTKDFNKAIKNEECEKAIPHIEGLKKQEYTKGYLSAGAGHLYSYSVTGAGYAADYSIKIVKIATIIGVLFVVAKNGGSFELGADRKSRYDKIWIKNISENKKL